MQRFVYWLAMAFIFPVSLLPFWALYRVSDGLYLLLYYLIGYRKTVVRANLARCFPEKTGAERKRIEKEFYRHLCDVIVESLKSYTIRPEALRKRMKHTTQELLEQYYRNGLDIIIAGGHYGNWEWAALATALYSPYRNTVIYRPLKNPYFDRLVHRNRSRYGLGLVPAREVARHLREETDRPSALFVLSDQNPPDVSKAAWMAFLGQETAVDLSTARLAQLSNRAVLFVGLKKVGRGRYEGSLHPLTDAPKTLSAEELTRKQFRALEQLILSNPPYWLWSHRRWKHRKEG